MRQGQYVRNVTQGVTQDQTEEIHDGGQERTAEQQLNPYAQLGANGFSGVGMELAELGRSRRWGCWSLKPAIMNPLIEVHRGSVP